jgi:hypothetical protein
MADAHPNQLPRMGDGDEVEFSIAQDLGGCTQWRRRGSRQQAGTFWDLVLIATLAVEHGQKQGYGGGVVQSRTCISVMSTRNTSV